MATTVVDEVATLLATNISALTLATSSGGNLYTIPIPEWSGVPSPAGHVIETGGQRSARAMGASLSDPSMDMTSLQVYLRASSTGAAGLRDLAESVFENLDHFSGAVSGRTIDYMRAEPPTYIGQDEGGRHRYVVNVDAMSRRTT